MKNIPIFVSGSYITQFGELWDKSLNDLTREAITGAIQDAHISEQQIEAVFFANMCAQLFDGQAHLGAFASQFFSHRPPAMHIEGACASGGLALLSAEYALLSGVYKTVMVLGAEKMSDVITSRVTAGLSGAADIAQEYGSTFPGLYALLAQAHMQAFGTSREQLSAVAAKNHRHGLKNPKAQFRKEIYPSDVSNSALIADPLRLLDCSPISDGAAAVILSTNPSNKPRIIARGHGQDSLDLASRETLTALSATQKAAHQAFSSAHLSPQDIAVAEVHDCFTIAELLALEDIGFFSPGEAGPATMNGSTTEGGKVFVNPSGGLKAAGHPVGATGVKQLAFLTQLLQTADYQFGLTHNVGGSGATAVVHIIEKGKT